MALLFVYAFVSIFFSFLCSILEAVLLSVTPTFINVKQKEGKEYARTLEEFKKDIDRPLIAILTLNTIAHTVGAILVGVQAKTAYKELYGDQVQSFFGVTMSEDLMVGIVSTVMTILILVASEIIPKTIGATYWKQLANFSAKTLNIMIFPLKYTGILWLLQLTTKLIGGKGHHGSVLSREDFTAMTAIAEEEGVFKESESKVIRNLLNFKKILTKSVMTPRTVMKIANEDVTIADFFKENQNLRFSRVPVFKDKTDNITGQVLKDEIFKEMANGNGEMTLGDIKRPILFTKRDLPIPELFDQLVETKHHIAVVVDEFGTISGIVSMEDVIETLLGLEIIDESDREDDMQELARKNWEQRAKQMGLLDSPTE
ncbi:CNNM domain-containing protein [Aquimarina sp. ERC-38]|uniref:CNNM domain-containing protein n=1 Tax=Aquimarina sp. ERC-38 TaxID=2949996 RepID=UPI0022458C7F|nr:CNNM domain-containing protein [Aquimarina sp. ERC-38]UZO82002.1 CNNM domain-containing protein [Aquimarina sp. ERC-38]